MKPIKAIKLIGTSEQAPGLKNRQHMILNKALGLDPQKQHTPQALAAMAQYHPDPTIQKKAAAALSSLEFNRNPLKGE